LQRTANRLLKKSFHGLFQLGRSCASLRSRHWGILPGTKQKVRFLLCFIFQTPTPCLKNGGPSVGRTQAVFQQPARTLHAAGFVLRFLWIGVGLAFARQAAGAADKAAAQLPAAAEPAIAGLLQVVLGLLVILLLIGGTAWLLRRFTHLQSTAQGNMKILGGLPLGPRERVVLIQVGDKQLLVGVAPGRVQTLHVLEQPLVFSTDKQGSQGFAERLALALKQRTTRTGQAL